MRVILFILKCTVGLLASLGFLMLLATVGLGLFWRQMEFFEKRETVVPERIVLSLDVGDSILEAQPDNPFSKAALGNPLDLRQIGEALERAGQDDNVSGLFLQVGHSTLGMAQVQELRDHLLAFQSKGKFVTAFAESFGEGGHGTLNYYLASAAGQIWLQPSGSLDITGFLLESPFLRAALDRIGVEPQLAQRSEFKGFMNTFTDNALPEPQRRNLQRLVDSWIGQFARDVAEARGLTAEDVRRLIDQGPYSGQQGPELGLIDHLGYLDQVNLAVFDLAGPDSDLLDLASYAPMAPDHDQEDTKIVALIYGIGPVTLGEGENDPVFGEVTMGSNTVAAALSDAIDDETVEAILFRVDSPGGSYVASDVIWREVQRARDAGKPVIVSMGNLAASGGYFVAAPAHQIVAQPGSITGSIGVVGGKLALKGLWENLSITWDGVQAGRQANIWSANQPFTPEGWAHLEKSLDRTYDDFTSKVSAGRGLSGTEVEDLARGQVWTGEDALALGLVDALGGFQTALTLAKEAIGLQADDAVTLLVLPAPSDSFRTLLKDFFSEGFNSRSLMRLSRSFYRVRQSLQPLIEVLDVFDGSAIREELRAPDLRLQN